MKKFFKTLLILIIIGAIGAGGYYVYTNYFSKSDGRDAFTLVPEDAIFIVESTNLNEGWNAISNSKVWHHLADEN